MNARYIDRQAVLYEHHLPSGGSPAVREKPDRPARDTRIDTVCHILHLGDLNQIVGRLHELFSRWETQALFPSSVSVDMLYRAQLAVHEWIANLMQHADFETLVPEILFRVWVEDEMLRCVIEDNSAGISTGLQPHITVEEVCRLLPDRGMGLLLLQECTDQMAYHRLGAQGNWLEFAIAHRQLEAPS